MAKMNSDSQQVLVLSLLVLLTVLTQRRRLAQVAAQVAAPSTPTPALADVLTAGNDALGLAILNASNVSAANVTPGTITDSLASTGAPGDVLTSTGAALQWQSFPPLGVPTLAQVLAAGDDADELDITNLRALQIDPPVGTAPAALVSVPQASAAGALRLLDANQLQGEAVNGLWLQTLTGTAGNARGAFISTLSSTGGNAIGAEVNATVASGSGKESTGFKVQNVSASNTAEAHGFQAIGVTNTDGSAYGFRAHTVTSADGAVFGFSATNLVSTNNDCCGIHFGPIVSTTGQAWGATIANVDGASALGIEIGEVVASQQTAYGVSIGQVKSDDKTYGVSIAQVTGNEQTYGVSITQVKGYDETYGQFWNMVESESSAAYGCYVEQVQGRSAFGHTISLVNSTNNQAVGMYISQVTSTLDTATGIQIDFVGAQHPGQPSIGLRIDQVGPAASLRAADVRAQGTVVSGVQTTTPGTWNLRGNGGNTVYVQSATTNINLPALDASVMNGARYEFIFDAGGSYNFNTTGPNLRVRGNNAPLSTQAVTVPTFFSTAWARYNNSIWYIDWNW